MLPLPLLPPRRPPGRFLMVWGRAVHLVDEGGAGADGPVALLESGLGGSWLGWDPVAAELLPPPDRSPAAEPAGGRADEPAEGPRPLRVLRADRPGLGRSQPAPGVPSLALRAAWTAALLDAVGVRVPVVVCGHSLGGLYAEAFARLYPGRVAGVVLVEAHAPNVTGAVLGHRQARVRAARLAGHAFRCAGLSQVVAPGVRRLGMRTQSARRGDQSDVGDAYRSAYGAGHCLTEAMVERVLVRDFLAELAELRATTRFPQVPLRVLCGVGAAPEVYGAQAAMSPLGRRVEVEGALHLMPVDRPDAIAAAVREAAAGPPRALPSPRFYDACP
ncbi:alpha/beta fold hydrolase [Streptacidiphilus jiangxiensis]|uniref:Pimeloyl-ACP methyl ester carboxylesterase n=1 Tax=Streptacidiphilus jiangxiensis TaxID=235985 RepID=A0A1H7N6V1_STRJI|nr:alpha/beta hydrolase [Streptacidiphilus jiangxiensis]SEL19031.1 Pimeloyl-ACP methyl ester carboxylesterase [Streptacidiphilus jiangxiensis]